MKSKAILFLPLTVILLLIYGFGGNAKWPGGSPGGYTGSPGDGFIRLAVKDLFVITIRVHNHDSIMGMIRVDFT